MEGGDISNVSKEGRTFVHARTFVSQTMVFTRKWAGLITSIERGYKVNLTELARIVRVSNALPRMILITTDGDTEYCEDLYEDLNNGYEHPFKGCATYASDQDLAVLLAWMPNTNVIDIPAKAGVFGVRYLELP